MKRSERRSVVVPLAKVVQFCLAFLPATILLVFGFRFVNRVFVEAFRLSPSGASALLSEYWKADVQIDRADFIVGGVRVEGARIVRGGYPLLTAAWIEARWPMRRGNPISIVAGGLDAVVYRDAKGKFNFDDLLPRAKEPRRSPIDLDLKALGARVRYVDDFVRKAKPTVSTQTQGVDLTLRTRGSSLFVLLNGEGDDLGDLAVRTIAHRGRAHVDVQADQAQWRFLRWYFPDFPVKIENGSGKVDVRIASGGGLPVAYSGTAEISADSALYQERKERWRNINGRIQFSNLGLRFEAQGVTAGGQASASGAMRRIEEAGEPKWRFVSRIAAQGTRVEQASRAIYNGDPKVRGRFAFNGAAWGDFEQPAIVGNAQVERVVHEDYSGSNVAGRVFATKGTAYLLGAQADALGGQIRGSALVALTKEPSFTAVATINRAQLSTIKQAGEAKGAFSAHIAASGTIDRPLASLYIAADRVDWQEANLSSIDARATYANGEIKVDAAKARLADALILGQGASKEGTLDGWLTATASNIQSVIRSFDPDAEPLQAVAYASVQLAGTTEKPNFSGTVQLLDMASEQWTAEALTARLNGSLDRFAANATLYRKTVAGSLEALIEDIQGESPTIDGIGSLRGIELADLLEATRQDYPASGLASLDFTAFGSLKNPELTAFLELPSLQVGSATLNQTVTALAEGSLSGARITANTEGDKLSASAEGEWSPEAFSITAQAVGEDFNLLGAIIPEERTITGPWRLQIAAWHDEDQIVGEASIEAGPLKSGGITIERLSAQADARDGLFSVIGSLKAKGEEAVEISLLASSESLAARAQSERVSLETVALIASELGTGWSPRVHRALESASGIARFEAEYGRNRTGEQGSLVFGAEDLKYIDEPLGTAEAAIAWSPEKWTVDRFEWKHEDARVNLAGSMLHDGPIEATFQAVNLQIPYSRLIDPTLPEVYGAIDAEATIKGTLESPEIIGALTARDIAISEEYTLVDKAIASLIEIKEGSIETNDVLILKEKSRAYLSVALPFSWDPIEVPRDKPINIRARAPKQELTGLENFAVEAPSPTVERPRAISVQGGEFEGDLTVTGTLDEPKPAGRLSVTAEKTMLSGYNTFLQDLKISARFEDDRLVLDEGSANSSEGGRLRIASLTADVSQLKEGAINAEISIENFRVDERKVEDLADRASAKLDGALTVQGTIGSPLVSGRINVSDGGIALPSEWQAARERRPYRYDPRFAINVGIGPNMRLQTANIDARPEGEIRIRGSLNEPQLQGRLTMDNGVLSFPTARLRIEENSAIDIIYPALDEYGRTSARLTLDVRARGVVTLPDAVTGDLRRYRVSLHITGPLDDSSRFRVDGESDPPGLSSERILIALGRGPALEQLAGGASAQDVLRSQLKDIFFSQVVRSGLDFVEGQIAEALGLEQFSLDYNEFTPASVYLSQYLGGNWGISYRRNFQETEGATYQVKIYYYIASRQRLLNRVKIGVGFDDEPKQFIFLEGSARFDFPWNRLGVK